MKYCYLTKTIKITSVIFIIIQSLTLTSLKAQHFNAVYSGNPYTPMNIIVNSSLLDDVLLQTGDELAVFDINGLGQEFCVGAVTIINEFSADTNYIISASADDPLTTDIQDGFINGNEIIFRYWDSNKNVEIILISETFEPSLDNVFQSFGTALVELVGYSYETWTGTVSTEWDNAANWNFGRIPSLLFDVHIPSNPTGNYFPTISSTNAKCESLILEENAIINVTGKLKLGNSGTPID